MPSGRCTQEFVFEEPINTLPGFGAFVGPNLGQTV